MTAPTNMNTIDGYGRAVSLSLVDGRSAWLIVDEDVNCALDRLEAVEQFDHFPWVWAIKNGVHVRIRVSAIVMTQIVQLGGRHVRDVVDVDERDRRKWAGG